MEPHESPEPMTVKNVMIAVISITAFLIVAVGLLVVVGASAAPAGGCGGG